MASIRGLAIVGLGSLVLAGCQGSQTASSPTAAAVAVELAAAPLPTYQVGDEVTYEYSGGEVVNRVVAVENDVVSWSNSKGETWARSTNLALPPLEWDVPQWGQGTHEVLSSSGALFPLSVGNRSAVEIRGVSTRYPDGWTNTRVCEVTAVESVIVPAGTFDAFRIECQAGNRSDLVFFAPAIDEYIYLDTDNREDDDQPTYRLVSVAPATQPGN